MKSPLSVTTKRLLIRPYLSSDYEEWREGYLGRLPKRSEFDPGPVSAERITKKVFRDTLALHKKARELDRLYVFGVFERRSKKIVGFLDIYVQSRLDFQCGNLGYLIHNQYWDRGYAKEAALGVLAIAFKKLKLHRIEAGVETENGASISVAKAIGMKKEGLRRDAVFENGHWKDLIYYSIVPEDIGLKSQKPSVHTSLRDTL